MEFFHQRNLPHLLPPGAELFITCRLAGSLPAAVVADLKQAFAPPDRLETTAESYARQRRYFGRFDTLLDGQQRGPQWLAQPAIGKEVLTALSAGEARGLFGLHAACVMPNHLHVVLQLPSYADRPFIRTWQSFKTEAARRANHALGRSGKPFWQPESYDHVIRAADERERIIRYVLHNPVKAGLCVHWQDWALTYLRPDWKPYFL